MTINNIEKIYYIQKEEIQLGETTVFAPQFYIDYNFAKAEFEKCIKQEKNSLDYLEDETEGLDYIMLKGVDEWGEIKIELYLRSRELNKQIIK
ncbi:hypothetical protein PN398_06855 [Romboutsia sp. 1001216sp1]|uniref:hypothetical protein n=1 Tax=Romboutsia sp. 1001216sp1 TaxID=2986997 RepID=UPI002330922F|nr:hypothetical protein [Romboutsia sp. 1001216sp1]MDB8790434.1 hypothetical protein [Romboutsia sp. 1001216sp1]